MRLDDKLVTLLATEDEILDFINYGIREDSVRENILKILSDNPEKDCALCIKIPYHAEPYCLLLKFNIEYSTNGLLLILSKEWKTIIQILREMINISDLYEREFLSPIADSAELQFKTLDKL